MKATMKPVLAIFALLCALLLTSCDKRNGANQFAERTTLTETPADQKATSVVENVSARKIIKEGEISFETPDAGETTTQISKIVQELNGYIAKDDVSAYNGRQQHRIEIRVPADKFELLLSKISENASKLDSRSITALDVTEEYIDIDARVKTKKELEERYKVLLQKATRVEEVLAIEKEIGLLRTEIESVEGRLRYLKDRISSSSLTVTYYQKTSSSFGFASKFGDGIKNGWENLLWFFIGLTQIWPFVLIIAVGLFFLMRRSKNQKSKRIVS